MIISNPTGVVFDQRLSQENKSEICCIQYEYTTPRLVDKDVCVKCSSARCMYTFVAALQKAKAGYIRAINGSQDLGQG